MTVSIPRPGRSSAASRSSSTGSPKRMKRPPLHVPTAVCPGDRITSESRMFSCLRAAQGGLTSGRSHAMVAIRPVSLAILMLALVPASAAANSATQIIVKREGGLTASERRDIRADADVRYVESLSLPRTEVVAAAPGDVRDAVRDLNADPDVVYAQPARP